MALPSKAKRRNPPDLTLRNLRAMKKRLDFLVKVYRTRKAAAR